MKINPLFGYRNPQRPWGLLFWTDSVPLIDQKKYSGQSEGQKSNTSGTGWVRALLLLE